MAKYRLQFLGEGGELLGSVLAEETEWAELTLWHGPTRVRLLRTAEQLHLDVELPNGTAVGTFLGNEAEFIRTEIRLGEQMAHVVVELELDIMTSAVPAPAPSPSTVLDDSFMHGSSPKKLPAVAAKRAPATRAAAAPPPRVTSRTSPSAVLPPPSLTKRDHSEPHPLEKDWAALSEMDVSDPEFLALEFADDSPEPDADLPLPAESGLAASARRAPSERDLPVPAAPSADPAPMMAPALADRPLPHDLPPPPPPPPSLSPSPSAPSPRGTPTAGDKRERSPQPERVAAPLTHSQPPEPTVAPALAGTSPPAAASGFDSFTDDSSAPVLPPPPPGPSYLPPLASSPRGASLEGEKIDLAPQEAGMIGQQIPEAKSSSEEKARGNHKSPESLALLRRARRHISAYLTIVLFGGLVADAAAAAASMSPSAVHFLLGAVVAAIVAWPVQRVSLK